MGSRDSESTLSRSSRRYQTPMSRLLHGDQGVRGWITPVVAAAAAAALVGGWLPLSVATGAGVLAAAFVLALTAALRGAGLYVGVAVGVMPLAVAVGLRAGGVDVDPGTLATIAATGFSGGVAGFALGYITLALARAVAAR